MSTVEVKKRMKRHKNRKENPGITKLAKLIFLFQSNKYFPPSTNSLKRRQCETSKQRQNLVEK